MLREDLIRKDLLASRRALPMSLGTDEHPVRRREEQRADRGTRFRIPEPKAVRSPVGTGNQGLAIRGKAQIPEGLTVPVDLAKLSPRDRVEHRSCFATGENQGQAIAV